MPNEAERIKLRGQALAWFRRGRFHSEVPRRRFAEASKELLGTVQGWQQTPDLAGVRDPEELAKLPEAERRSWQALWAEVETLEKRLRAASQ